ncbi:MAG: galactose-1-phosphate uridylyltransferase [Nitrospiraceae bacterium]|nr:galactose-1-phosphate uridylyltransferase [Nitrospiraceae bacterium]
METRKDYLLNYYVIIAENRHKRPSDFVTEVDTKPLPPYDENCPFCFGNESLTTSEHGRIEDDEHYPDYPWLLKWVDNKFPAVDSSRINGPFPKTDNSFFTFADSFGSHLVLIETPRHNEKVWDFDEHRIGLIFDAYSRIIDELNKTPETRYVLAFKNNGPKAGTSLVHTHSQVISFSIVPKRIREEWRAFDDFKSKSSKCPFCEIINVEKSSLRRVMETEHFVAFTPYASRCPFEVWVFPKQHVRTITELDKSLFDELGGVLKPILAKLKELNASFNWYLHNSGKDNDFHFHLEICPRLSTFGGVELNGTYINVISPEDAASFYRGEKENI